MNVYPTISKDLLTNAINFASTVTAIEEKELTLPCTQGSSFYLTLMESESKKIILMLTLLLEASMEQRYVSCTETMVLAFLKIGLYLSWKKSKIRNVKCKDNGLNITMETNLHITDYLDSKFNLETRKYYPYRKQNNSLQYIHKQSNHPPSMIQRIPSMISKRLSEEHPVIKNILTKLHRFIMMY